MKQYLRNKWMVYLLLASACDSPSIQADEIPATATIKFHGTSTLHDFHGTVPAQPFVISYIQQESNTVHFAASTSLKVAQMDTDNKKRDKNMRKWLEQPKFPLISGTIEDALLPIGADGSATLKLSIRNVTQDVPVRLTDLKEENGIIQCRMLFTVDLPQFHLKPPSIMGMINVGKTVDIECTVTAKRADVPSEGKE